VTNFADDETKSKLVQFRCHPRLLNAMERAADRQFTSISDIARASIAQAMRANGLLDENA
jgi:hypothetical protein